jgi:hypothetical protein
MVLRNANNGRQHAHGLPAQTTLAILTPTPRVVDLAAAAYASADSNSDYAGANFDSNSVPLSSVPLVPILTPSLC